METEYKDLLDECERNSADDAERQEAVSWSSPKRNISTWLCNPWICHVTLALFYSFVFLFMIMKYIPDHSHGPNLIYSPAREAVRFEKVTFDGSFIIDSPFTGDPQPQQSQAWHDLLQNSNIRVSEETLRNVGHESIPFSDGNGYYAELGVFHELHCLKRIRGFINDQKTRPNDTDHAHHIDWLHTDHCLEILRQGAMCRGDISLVTFRWAPTSRLPLADFSRPHECVDFGAIDRWAGQHAVDAFEPGLLRHPELGDSFPVVSETGGEVGRMEST